MINRQSRVPYYYQLYEILRGKITSGEWKPGDIMPTEAELLGQYNVSRSTVRQAMDMLVNNGQIYRQRGRGSFVAHPTVEQGLSQIISFTEEMQRRGMNAHTEVLSSGLVLASAETAQFLQVEPGEELARLERLRMADNEPMSIEESYLVHRYCPGVLDQDYATVPLREMLMREYGLRWAYAKQTIQAIDAPKKIADKLAIKSKASILYIERTSFTEQNTPVEFIRFYHRGDRYVLYNELQG